MSVPDRAVAIEVMGWTPLGAHYWVPASGSTMDACLERELPPYTEDIPAAMQVVAKMESDGWRWSVYGPSGGYNCTFYRAVPADEDAWKLTRSRIADTLPQAICEAALAAKRAAKEAQ